MAKVLTDALCKAAQAMDGKRAELADARCPGLTLRITADGVKSWSFRFRDPASGPKANPQRMMLGRYPDVSLSDARAKATKHREAVAAGKNPIAEKAQERLEAPKLTYDYLADRYMNEHARRHKRPRSADEDDRNLRNHILPKWAARKYRSITRADVVILLEGIIAAGFHTAANRVQALISKIFSFGIDAGLLDANPAARLQKRGKETTGERVLSDAEIKLFWRKIIHPPVTFRTGIALRLALLTGCRANEIVGMRRSEIDHMQDPKRRAWTVPGSRTKNKRPHLIPLTAQAWDLIAKLFDLIDDGKDFLFPSPKKDDQPIGRHSLAVATKRFCTAMDGGKPRWIEQTFSPHDLRRTFSTKLSSLGVVKEDRSACLNHTASDVDSRHYDRYERAAEKRVALQKLSDEVSRLIKDRRGYPTGYQEDVDVPVAANSPSAAVRQSDDILKGIGGGLVRGVAGVAGLPDMASDFLVYAGDQASKAITGESDDAFKQRLSDRRANVMLPSVSDAISTQGIQRGIESVTGAAYVPQTRAGKFASAAAEFAPGGMIGRPANIIGNTLRYGVAPGLASEAGGQAFEGSAMETPARIGGALVAGIGAAATQRAGSAERLLNNSTRSTTATELDAMEELFQRSIQAGTPISRSEALQAVTNGRTGMGDLQHTVEGMGGMKEFYSARPANNQRAAVEAFDNVAPRAADPDQLGPAIGGAGERIVMDVRAAINQATRPMYDAAGQHLVPQQVHRAMMADPLFAETVNTIRRDPARNATVQAASDRSVRMYDAVAKELEQRAQNAAQPLNPNASQAIASTTGRMGSDVKDIAIASERAATGGPSAYEAALATQTRLREQYLNPLLNGPIGKLAGRDTSTAKAIEVLFPANPLPGSEQAIAQAVTAVAARQPAAARALVRTHAEMTFNEAAQRLATSGPSQSGGAKFAAVLRGNEQQAANLEAAVRALPNGDAVWPGFNRFLEIMEAQQFRQATGSRTAFKIPGVEDLKSGGLANNTAQIIAGGGFKWPAKVQNAIQQWNVGRNLDELAGLLTRPDAAAVFRQIVEAPTGSNKAGALATRLTYLGLSAPKDGWHVPLRPADARR